MIKLAMIVLVTALITGCTDARKANFTTIGSPADVVCYSGGKEIYKGRSTGKVATTMNSDGWEFVDATTSKFIRVSGDCVVTN